MNRFSILLYISLLAIPISPSDAPNQALHKLSFSFNKSKTIQRAFFDEYLKECKTNAVVGACILAIFVFKAHYLSDIIIPLGIYALGTPVVSLGAVTHRFVQRDVHFMQNAFLQSQFRLKNDL